MRILSFIAILFFFSSGLFAQSQQQVLPATSIEEKTTNPEKTILGKWILKSVAGETEIDGAPVKGYIIFEKDKTFKGIMMGDEGNGTYRFVTKDNKLSLEVTEKGVISSLEVKSLTSKDFVLTSDGAEMVFAK